MLKFKGYASIFNEEDSNGDIVKPGAFTKSLQLRPRVAFVDAHNAAAVVGMFTLIQEDSRGLYVEGIVTDKDKAALVEAGALWGLSIGFNPIVTTKYHYETRRELHQVELCEVSLCSVPMGRTSIIHHVYHDPPEDEVPDPLIRPSVYPPIFYPDQLGMPPAAPYTVTCGIDPGDA